MLEAVEAIKSRYPVQRWGLFNNKSSSHRENGALGGRPVEIDENRLEAIANGLKLYEGKPCSKCDSRIRYVSNRACRDCVLRHNKKIQERKRCV